MKEYRVKFEDYVIITIIIAILIFIAIYFSITTSSVKNMTNYSNEYSLYNLNYLKSEQLIFNFYQERRTFDLLSNALYVQSIKTTAGFLIGALISLLGCIIVIRGTRSKISANLESATNKASIVTDSSGLFITTLGVILICYTVTLKSRISTRTKPVENRSDNNQKLIKDPPKVKLGIKEMRK